jgi:hypothetical protein
MYILKPISEPQEYKIIPRVYATSVLLKITDENLGTTVSYTINPTLEFGWMILSETFNLVEGRFYRTEVIILDGDTVFRGRIFCTNQEDYSKYQMTSGSFSTSNPVNNDIIIL